MILDYAFNKTKRQLSVSYITETGGKRIMNFNATRFKSYFLTPSGMYNNWDGSRCDVRWVDSPSTFDIKTYFEEMSETHKELLQGKTSPNLYTFDIETEISDEFPEPSEAKFPITTISVASPNCNVVVLGTKDLEDGGDKLLQNRFDEYLEKSDFFKGLKMKTPYIKYIKFNSERDMLEHFLKNIVAKVPVLAGWNSIMFDWQYIQNRIKGYYPDLSIQSSSLNWMTTAKNYTDMRGNKVRLIMPNHTLILDMMDVVGNFDMVVMPIKESLSLDYIASESIGMNKIKYDGDLQKLFEEDYSTYVFYNAIDSILVQLIDKKFKTLQNIYTQSLYCKEKIGSCFSKIALTEALVFNYFYEKGIKVVPTRREDVERGTLIGAYVRVPTPGKHNFVCCNDFASLYPSTIITCNLSFENYIGNGFDEIELEKYRQDPNYFVSVNGNVYRNNKTYAFKDIQATLKSNRNTGKYLAKQLEAVVMTDIDHILGGHEVSNQTYQENLVQAMKNIGYDVVDANSLLNLKKENQLVEFKAKLHNEIKYYTSFEQAMKLLGNSMYGGSSHVAFFWFNMNLANDITGEARNIIHKMEAHIPEYLKNAWPSMIEFHKKHNIELDEKFVKGILNGDKSFVNIVYGDTDSCAKDTIIRIERDGVRESLTIEDLYNRYIKNDAGATMMGHESVSCDCKILNWDKDLYFGSPKRIIRHRVTKPKWRLKTKDGKEIFVTNDHSMIVFRDGKKIEVKPKDILKTDKILIVK